ncbi:MAG: PAS domain-containing protein [Ktedonobacteraceae bacterium]
MSDTIPKKQQTLAQIEEALPERDQLFGAVWENASDAMALSTADGIVFAANGAYFRLYGYSPEAIIGKNYAIIFPEEQRKAAQELYSYIFQSPTISPSFETLICRADGVERFVESSYNFITHNGKRIAMISIVRDITTRKKAEEELHINQIKLHLALKVGQMSSWDWDIESNIIRWPVTLEATGGFVPGSSNVGYESFLQLIYPEDRSLVEQEIKRALEEGTDYNVEFRYVLPNGEVRKTRTLGEVLFDEAGKAIRMVGIGEDIEIR